ncbi:MAG: RNA polymerase sigma factor [Flavobacteriaceae bacterium]
MDTYNEKLILRNFANGDIDAFSSLFRYYYPLLMGYGLKLCQRKAIVEDTLQEFFIHIFHQREKLQAADNPKAYLFVSYRRALIQKIKEQKRFSEWSEEALAHNGMQFSAEELMIRQELTSVRTSVLAHLLNGLSPREREVIYLRYHSGLKNDAIAEVMEISYQSVLNTLQKAFGKLRQRLEKEALKSILSIS